MKAAIYWFSFLLAVLWACENKNEETALIDLFQKEKALNCQLASMKDSITTEWDNINQLLAESLPADMPAEEKNNMLKVRNANLIRMFQSFDDVDKEVKLTLSKTEQLDIEMTKRITTLKKEIQKIESRKMALFQKINQTEGPDEIARLQGISQALLSESCE